MNNTEHEISNEVVADTPVPPANSSFTSSFSASSSPFFLPTSLSSSSSSSLPFSSSSSFPSSLPVLPPLMSLFSSSPSCSVCSTSSPQSGRRNEHRTQGGDAANSRILNLPSRIPDPLLKPRTYLSVDKYMHSNPNDPPLPPGILNQVNEGTFPAHSITLKEGAVIILLRNIDIQGGLCNGTRLVIDKLGENLLECTILTSRFFGVKALIPRMNLLYNKRGMSFSRFQFPVRLCYAMTIHKCQGQTFDRVGVDFTASIFTHGLLYVALSRCRDPENISIYLGPNPTPPYKIMNVVYKEVLPLETFSVTYRPSLPSSPQ